MSLMTVACSFFHEREPWNKGFSATIMLALYRLEGLGRGGVKEKDYVGVGRLRQLLCMRQEPPPRQIATSFHAGPCLGVGSTVPMVTPLPFNKGVHGRAGSGIASQKR